ncbi:hypothetical protein [Tardiphaga robiniae]|uniref:Uncharacterized protein n=1 Tax=Tardiphaga robiniae TaxID=943830 RepID=A0A163XPQ8_9BRAD|nr:hypothetical protein [Tardiphaga robiniae]KZD21180.1 hypothetical protein A4A58_15500 [Tardiphaga robiniae]
MDQPNNVIPFPRKPLQADEDDYAHRMLLNGVACAWILVVVGSAAWTFEVIATIPKRDCNFSARRPCTSTAQRATPPSFFLSDGVTN